MNRNKLKYYRDELGYNIFCIPSGYLQNQIRKLKKIGFNCGKYGWNYDVYFCDTYIVITGNKMPQNLGFNLTKTECKELSNYSDDMIDILDKYYNDNY